METTEQLAARRAYAAVCAKLGEPDAAAARPSGSLGDLHAARKGVRRLVNKLQAITGEPEEAEALAMAHAANLVSRIDGMIVALGGHSAAQATGPKVLRTADDIRAHYAGKSTQDERLELGDFLRGAVGMKTTQAVRNALSEGTDSAGGFTLPSVVMPNILEALVPASSVMQAGAGIVPVDMGAKSYTIAAVQTPPTAAWRLESGTVASSDMVFRGITMVPHSLSFVTVVSRELAADSANFGMAFAHAAGQAMAVAMDYAALRGTGTAPVPRGILNWSGVGAQGNGTNGASGPGFDTILSAFAGILQQDAPMPNAAIMSPRSWVRLANQVDTQGQPKRRPDALADVKFLTTSQIPNNLTVGSSSDCSELYLGDFTKVQYLLREQMSIQVLDQLYAGTGQLGFMVHARVDVAILYAQAFTVITGLR